MPMYLGKFIISRLRTPHFLARKFQRNRSWNWLFLVCNHCSMFSLLLPLHPSTLLGGYGILIGPVNPARSRAMRVVHLQKIAVANTPLYWIPSAYQRDSMVVCRLHEDPWTREWIESYTTYVLCSTMTEDRLIRLNRWLFNSIFWLLASHHWSPKTQHDKVRQEADTKDKRAPVRTASEQRSCR